MTESILPPSSPLAISVSGLGKRFPGVVALDQVSLDIVAGTVTAVMGENGAGKSTLMSILAGLRRPDSGAVFIDGRPVASFTPDAMLHEHGVALVPQEIALCADRSVAENVLLGREPGWIPSRRGMIAETASLLRQIDTGIDPRARAGSLSVAEQQLVLIVRALARDCRVLILDEPTTSLTSYEVERLFRLLRRLREQGTTIVYVSHRLPEVFELSDSIHVLRDGRLVASLRTSEVTSGELVQAMVGRELSGRVERGDRVVGPSLLEVDNLSGQAFTDVTFSVRSGEIVGVAGLPDSGRSELVASLFGALPTTGRINLDGDDRRIRSPREAMRRRVGYVPAERRSQGLFPDMSVAANSTILDIDGAARLGVVSRRRLKQMAADRLRDYDVRGSVGGSITGLSGGNQQKVILSRWLARQPRLLLLDDPTRGVDVGAKAEIHARIAEAASDGAAVVMASSDLPELLRSCDRIVVMAQGRLAGVVDAGRTDERTVMALATGTKTE